MRASVFENWREAALSAMFETQSNAFFRFPSQTETKAKTKSVIACLSLQRRTRWKRYTTRTHERWQHSHRMKCLVLYRQQQWLRQRMKHRPRRRHKKQYNLKTTRRTTTRKLFETRSGLKWVYSHSEEQQTHPKWKKKHQIIKSHRRIIIQTSRSCNKQE